MAGFEDLIFRSERRKSAGWRLRRDTKGLSTLVSHPNSAGSWKQEVSRRVAAHQSRDLSTPKSTLSTQKRLATGSRCAQAVARVVARYAQAPSYSQQDAKAYMAQPSAQAALPDPQSASTRPRILEPELPQAVAPMQPPVRRWTPTIVPALPAVPSSLEAWESECSHHDWEPGSAHLDLKNAIHVGHSTGGGEVTRYLGRHGESRVAKAALISAIPPLMLKTAANPLGLPKAVFDDLQAQLAANRSQFYLDLPTGPFYGFNRPGVKSLQSAIWNWWRQGMMGGAKAHYDGIVAFSQTDFTEDLKKITVPVLVMHSEDDQIVPYVASGPLTAKLLKNGTLKTYKDFPHGMITTQAETVNAELLAFFKS